MPMASASDGRESTIPGLPRPSITKNRLSHVTREHNAGIIMREILRSHASDSYFGH
jgi:hypothetical protein